MRPIFNSEVKSDKLLTPPGRTLLSLGDSVRKPCCLPAIPCIVAPVTEATQENEVIAEACPLCGGDAEQRWHERMQRRYRWCLECDLVSVHPGDIVSRESEAARYLEHDNGFHQPGYVQMLSRLLDRAVTPRIPSGGKVLDYGCGYAPVLTELARRRGYYAAAWDPYFLDSSDALARRYDAVVACEVVEHVSKPAALFEHAASLLEPDGLLVVRSSLHPAGWDAFFGFWYTWDRTHVSFYSDRTVRLCAERFGFTVEKLHDPVWLLRRRPKGEA